MRRRIVYAILVLALAGGLTLFERTREAGRLERMQHAVEMFCRELRADARVPLPAVDAVIAPRLREALVGALSPDGALAVAVESADRSPATHRATVSIAGRAVIVLGLAESSARGVVVTGFELR